LGGKIEFQAQAMSMVVMKANALDFARQIDELRCLLVESAPKDAPNCKTNPTRG
jgi:hypothetical protein